MRARLASLLLLALLLPTLAFAQGIRRPPTIDDLLKVTSVGGARLSPDGNRVAYSVNETDFTADAFISHLWITDVATGRTFQLTRGDKSEGNAQWSPDGAWLSFTSDRVGGRNQVFVISPNGGEAVQLTKAENGVNGYSWSRDGRRIAYTSSDADAKATNLQRRRCQGDEGPARQPRRLRGRAPRIQPLASLDR
jgi:dipeptidyl aminopeptidase/acylaminoacyl peptidase